jgi:hypothetical protein
LGPQQLAGWPVFDQRLGWALALRKAWRGRRRKLKGHFNSGTIRHPSQSNPSVTIATINDLRDALVTAKSTICYILVFSRSDGTADAAEVMPSQLVFVNQSSIGALYRYR